MTQSVPVLIVGRSFRLVPVLCFFDISPHPPPMPLPSDLFIKIFFFFLSLEMFLAYLVYSLTQL